MQPVTETVTDSKGIRKYNYRYSWDYPSNSICANLISKNLGLPAIIKEEWKDTTKLIGFTYNEYNSSRLLSKIHKLNSREPLTTTPLTEGSGTYSINTNVVKPEIIFDSYDNKGNVTQYHKNNDIYTTILWGYNKYYPIAKIENATYTDVQSALGGTVPDCLGTYHVSALRAALPNARFTTFSYSPLIGMISRTDDNGVTTNFEYDGLGRLKGVFDNDYKATGYYRYHYAGQQIPSPQSNSLTVSATSEVFEYGGGNAQISVTGNVPWTVSASDDWILVDSDWGENNGTFTITCQSNNFGDARNGSVKVTGGGIIRTITISQDEAPAVEYEIVPENSTFVVSPYSNPMTQDVMDLYYAIPGFEYNLYYNLYINIQSNYDPNPVGIYVWYYNESDWLDFSYDEETHQVTFWATYVPSQTDYAYVVIASDEIGQSRRFLVKIGY